MNKIIKKILLTGGKFILELDFRKPGFTDLLVAHLLNILQKFKILEKK